MKSEVSKSKHLRVINSAVDIFFETENKKIWMPSGHSNNFQFNLEDKTLYEPGKGRPAVGWVKITTEVQFDEFFDALKSLSSFESVEDFYRTLSESTKKEVAE